MTDPIKPTMETPDPNLSTEHQEKGDARRPSDTLDRGRRTDDGHDAPPRKSSLIGDDDPLRRRGPDQASGSA